MINRRTLLKSAAMQALILPALSAPAWANDAELQTQFMLCARNADGQFVAVKITDDGKIAQQFTLADRGHGHAKSLNGDIAIFARRPNNQLYLIDKLGQMRVAYAPDDRHFFGHGVFSDDGKLLYTSENDFDNEDENATGVIGIWDVKQAQKIGEFSSHGIGVHQITLLPDGETLVVANGGILTHPDHPRQKLNLAHMQPNLALVNRKNGQLIEKFSLPAEFHQLSIRHLDVTADSEVVIAMQYQGGLTDDVPLLARISKHGELIFTQTPPKILKQNRQYIGSVCFDKTGTYFAATSPRGNIVSIYAENGVFLQQFLMQDVCAIAANSQPFEFICASGMGDIWLYNAHKNTVRKLRNQSSKASLYQWDNHMFAL
ncbi:MAG: DUF1513 domain-containing protein [Hyphomicrobiales bacterium]